MFCDAIIYFKQGFLNQWFYVVYRMWLKKILRDSLAGPTWEDLKCLKYFATLVFLQAIAKSQSNKRWPTLKLINRIHKITMILWMSKSFISAQSDSKPKSYLNEILQGLFWDALNFS